MTWPEYNATLTSSYSRTKAAVLSTKFDRGNGQFLVGNGRTWNGGWRMEDGALGFGLPARQGERSADCEISQMFVENGRGH